MRLSSVIVVVGVVLAMLICPTRGTAQTTPQTVDLAPKFTVGQEDRFWVDLLTTREARFVDSDVTRPARWEQRARVRRRVLETSPAGAKIEILYETIKVSFVAGNRSVAYDTEIENPPETEEVGKTVRPALNRPVVVEVDSTGRVVGVTGNKVSEGETPSQSLMGDDTFRTMLSPLFGLTKSPSTVSVGEYWTEVIPGTPQATGTITTRVSRHLRSVENDRVLVTFTGTMTLDPSEKALMSNANIEAQALSGKIEWDLVRGHTISYRQEWMMKLTAETEGRQRAATTTNSAKIDWIEKWPPDPAKDDAPTTEAKPSEAAAPAANP